ncbi:MAG: NADH-quinone oxidoreductase subunit K, partial [Desulfocapsaceae bacterium]|nr:NADH-quinone oxidoreductase subunit K [Desulfocapsaceae bacterium]
MSLLTLYNNLNTFLYLAAMLFGMGIYGLVTRRTLIGMLIASELILAAASINFMAFNR